SAAFGSLRGRTYQRCRGARRSPRGTPGRSGPPLTAGTRPSAAAAVPLCETGVMLRSAALVDLDAIRDNVARLLAGTSAEVMAVVKAEGYGHGLLASARAALAGGAGWLGVAFVEEALALRAAGIEAPVLAWLLAPGEDLAPVLAAGVDVSVNAGWGLPGVAGGARTRG